MCLLLVFAAFALSAQNEQMRHYMQTNEPVRGMRTASANNVRYWVGTGTNEVLATVFFCAADTGSAAVGIVYGYRHNGTATINDMLSAIAAADPNFTYNLPAGSTFISSIGYNNGNYSHQITGSNMMYTLYNNNNPTYPSGALDPLGSNDCLEITQWNPDTWDVCGPCDSLYYPFDPNITDATINELDVQYWVGNGENAAIVAVNWCNPSTTKAWGVMFDGDSALVADLLQTIAIYDSRFSYTGGGGMIYDIQFNDGTEHLSLQGNWWMYNLNGYMAWLGYDQQKVANGDVIKFGDEMCGIMDDYWQTYWTDPVLPVALPAPSTETFDGIVGSDNCQAIKFDNAAIQGWATNCTVSRGFLDIANPATLAFFGNESAGVGPSSLSTMDAVSLGDGGTAVLTFDQPISNGEGYDFAVFENALNNTFLELAFVEVSSDGVHYYRFPSVSNTQVATQIANAGSVDATQLHNLAGKYMVGWGTPFDLAELDGYSNLDINNVTHVRLVDVVGTIDPMYATTDKNGHIINDPYPTNFTDNGSGGFDLTGVAVMNGWTPNSVNDITPAESIVAYPNPCQSTLYVNQVPVGETVTLCNAFGQMVWSGVADNTQVRINMQDLPSGIYILKAGNQTGKIVKR